MGSSGHAVAYEPITCFDVWLRYAIRDNDRCHFWSGSRLIWKSTNSQVVSLPSFDFRSLFEGLPYRNIACSLVAISGPTDENLHFHTSDVIGLVTKGAGRLRHAVGSAAATATEVTAGDICFIPNRVLHLFDTEYRGELEYIALEMSAVDIDYQKHWSPDEL